MFGVALVLTPLCMIVQPGQLKSMHTLTSMLVVPAYFSVAGAHASARSGGGCEKETSTFALWFHSCGRQSPSGRSNAVSKRRLCRPMSSHRELEGNATTLLKPCIFSMCALGFGTRQCYRCVQHLYVLPTIHHRSISWQQYQAHVCGMHDIHADYNTVT